MSDAIVDFGKMSKETWEDIVSLAFESLKDDILLERFKEYILGGHTDGMAFYIANLLEYALLQKYGIGDTEPVEYVN